MEQKKKKRQDERNSEEEATAMPEPGMSRHRRRVSICYCSVSVGGLGYENIAKNFAISFHPPHWPFVLNNSCLCKRTVIKCRTRSL